MQNDTNNRDTTPSEGMQPEMKKPSASRPEVGLYEKLRLYCETDAYPFHMPGHKRNLGSLSDPYRFDITEIDGFDNLHHAEDVLLRAQQRAAALIGAKETFYLVNGSTCGLLAAISAAVSATHTDTILMARNCHKAVYHALAVNRLKAEYLYPESFDREGNYPFINGRISPEKVAEALEKNPSIKVVVITSPTYDGVISEVDRIAEAVHAKEGILIVDEAHGAHFGLADCVPQSAVKLGADLVIQSVHKTLPALTQTALLHRVSDRVSTGLLQRYLGIYQTSSPSYVLMSSIDHCIRIMTYRGRALLEQLMQCLELFYREMEGLKHLHLLRTDDPSKIIIVTEQAGLSGNVICDILRNSYGLEMEMAAASYVLALCAVGDTPEGFERLAGALYAIDEMIERGVLKGQAAAARSALQYKHLRLKQKKTIYEAWEAPTQATALENAAGAVSGEFIYLYPPGIPLVVPGEVVEEAMICTLEALMEQGYSLQGMEDHSGKMLRILR